MLKMSSFLHENHLDSPPLTWVNVFGVLGVLNVLNVLNVLHVLNTPMDASLACWALFYPIRGSRRMNGTVSLWRIRPTTYAWQLKLERQISRLIPIYWSRQAASRNSISIRGLRTDIAYQTMQFFCLCKSENNLNHRKGGDLWKILIESIRKANI